MTANAAKRLIQHYVDNFRRLPWRSPPGHEPPDPYRVWLSEVMLQQTTVATVAARFERFVGRWPTIEALAAASDEEVLSEWAGLGYYARARNLIACAREVAKRGDFPTTAAGLGALPGIGRYTSAAIGAIAFGEHVPAVDTNVERVFARLDGLRRPARRQIERRVLELMPIDRPGDFVQAVMDLGATVCRPRNPLCGQCPLQRDCTAFRGGTPEQYPERRERRARPRKSGVDFWTERAGSVWLVRRPSNGLLGGMAALPGGDWTEVAAKPMSTLAVVSHDFTHFALELAIIARSDAEGEGWWHPLEQLDEAGLPTLYRKAVQLVMNSNDRFAA